MSFETKYVIAAAAGGGVALIMAVVMVVWFCRARRSAARRGRPLDPESAPATPKLSEVAAAAAPTAEPANGSVRKADAKGSALDDLMATDPLYRGNVRNPLYRQSGAFDATAEPRSGTTPIPRPESFGFGDESEFGFSRTASARDGEAAGLNRAASTREEFGFNRVNSTREEFGFSRVSSTRDGKSPAPPATEPAPPAPKAPEPEPEQKPEPEPESEQTETDPRKARMAALAAARDRRRRTEEELLQQALDILDNLHE